MNVRSTKYKKIGERLIKTLPEFEELKSVRIAWLESDKEKKKNRKIVYAECIKVDDKYDWCCRYDFMIVVYKPNVYNFSDEQIRILLEHEIHHVGIDEDGTERKYYVVPHDIEEFWAIIDKYGMTWDEVS